MLIAKYIYTLISDFKQYVDEKIEFLLQQDKKS